MGLSVNDFRAFRPAPASVRVLRRSPLWVLVASVLLLAQFALAFHQLNHRAHPGATFGDSCTLCQVVTNMGAAPAPFVIVPPTLTIGGYALALAPQALRQSRPASGFHSRAPPHSV